MKLIRCNECFDIFNLAEWTKVCSCEKSYGRYIDLINATVHGPCDVLGIDNASFSEARFMQESHPEGLYMRGTTTKQYSGWKFEAFFIPEGAPTVRREK